VASAELDGAVFAPRQASVSLRLRSERKFGRPAVLTGLVLLSVTLNRHFDPRDLVLHCLPKRSRRCRAAQPPDRRIGAARGSRNTERRLVSKGDGSLDLCPGDDQRQTRPNANLSFSHCCGRIRRSHGSRSGFPTEFGALRAAGDEIDMVGFNRTPKREFGSSGSTPPPPSQATYSFARAREIGQCRDDTANGVTEFYARSRPCRTLLSGLCRHCYG
jgi:hypothetical protein